MLRLFLNLIGRFMEQDLQKQPASRAGEGRAGDRQLNFLVSRYFRLEQVG
jgi:hypothetical protein